LTHSSEHNLSAVSPVLSFHQADTIHVSKKVLLKDVAEAIDVPVDLLAYLNPVYKRGYIPKDDAPQVLRIPTEKMPVYLASLDKLYQASDEALANEEPEVNFIERKVKKYHVVKRGEHMGLIADKYDCTIGDIKRWNKMKSTRVQKGQRLLVYTITRIPAQTTATAAQPSSPQTADSAVNAVKGTSSVPKEAASKKSHTDAGIIWHVVQPGDTLWKIANRYNGVTVEDIKNLNMLNSNNIQHGTKLKLKIAG
jgi:membrane-bound lytic murein transglycosylase D